MLRKSHTDIKQEVINAVSIWGISLKFASKEMRDDRDVVIEAVKNYGYALRFASERLQDDEDIALLALQNITELSKDSKPFGNRINKILENVTDVEEAIAIIKSKTQKEQLELNIKEVTKTSRTMKI